MPAPREHIPGGTVVFTRHPSGDTTAQFVGPVVEREVDSHEPFLDPYRVRLTMELTTADGKRRNLSFDAHQSLVADANPDLWPLALAACLQRLRGIIP